MVKYNCHYDMEGICSCPEMDIVIINDFACASNCIDCIDKSHEYGSRLFTKNDFHEIQECIVSQTGSLPMIKHALKLTQIIVVIAVLSGAASAQIFLFQDMPKENVQLGLRFLRPFF